MAATVIAATAVDAEVLCKVALLAEPTQAAAYLADGGASAVVVREDGHLAHLGEVASFAA